MYCPNSKCPDALRTGHPGEYKDETSECPKCGARLASNLPNGAEDPPMGNPGSVELVPCLVLGDASMVPHARALLESAGIPHFVKNEGVQNLIGWGTLGAGFNPVVGEPVVMVEASDVEQARVLLRTLDDSRKEQRVDDSDALSARKVPSSCSRCDGRIEIEEPGKDLSHCYHCGWPL